MVMDAVFKLTFLLSYPESRDAIASINVPVTSIKLSKRYPNMQRTTYLAHP